MFDGDPERKVAAKGKAHEEAWTRTRCLADIAYCMKRLLRQGAVKQLPVEVMALPVVPEVKTKDIITQPVKKAARRENVSGISAAFPAVKKDHKAFCRSFGLT